MRKLGKEYGAMQTKIVNQKAALFLKLMAKQGAKVVDFPAAERNKWVSKMPDLAGDWSQANGAAGRQVLKAFMDGIRKRGGKPARDWDKGNM
jgi:TRAP-type C4-dicarboxylate transport system substrate-binding protein